MKTIRLRISGRVQGVGYRAWAVDAARRLGLSGWVRNRADGSVEAVISGEEARVDEMTARCRRGPGMARVEAVLVSEAAPDDAAHSRGVGFTALPTA